MYKRKAVESLATPATKKSKTSDETTRQAITSPITSPPNSQDLRSVPITSVDEEVVATNQTQPAPDPNTQVLSEDARAFASYIQPVKPTKRAVDKIQLQPETLSERRDFVYKINSFVNSDEFKKLKPACTDEELDFAEERYWVWMKNFKEHKLPIDRFAELFNYLKPFHDDGEDLTPEFVATIDKSKEFWFRSVLPDSITFKDEDLVFAFEDRDLRDFVVRSARYPAKVKGLDSELETLDKGFAIRDDDRKKFWLNDVPTDCTKRDVIVSLSESYNLNPVGMSILYVSDIKQNEGRPVRNMLLYVEVYGTLFVGAIEACRCWIGSNYIRLNKVRSPFTMCIAKVNYGKLQKISTGRLKNVLRKMGFEVSEAIKVAWNNNLDRASTLFLHFNSELDMRKALRRQFIKLTDSAGIAFKPYSGRAVEAEGGDA